MRISKAIWNVAHANMVVMNAVAVVASKEAAAVIVGVVETVAEIAVVLAVSKEVEIVEETVEVVSKEAVTVIRLLVVLVWIAKANLTVLTKTWCV
jgi:hypothetical protein